MNKTTLIHDPVVLSSGSIPSAGPGRVAVALGVAAVAVGVYAAFYVWKKDQR